MARPKERSNGVSMRESRSGGSIPPSGAPRPAHDGLGAHNALPERSSLFIISKRLAVTSVARCPSLGLRPFDCGAKPCAVASSDESDLVYR